MVTVSGNVSDFTFSYLTKDLKIVANVGSFCGSLYWTFFYNLYRFCKLFYKQPGLK